MRARFLVPAFGIILGLAHPVNLMAQVPSDSAIVTPLLEDLRALLVPSSEVYSDTLVREVAELHSVFGHRDAALRILQAHVGDYYSYARVALVDLGRGDVDAAVEFALRNPDPQEAGRAVGYIITGFHYPDQFEEALSLARQIRWPYAQVNALEELARRLRNDDRPRALAILEEAQTVARADTSRWGSILPVFLTYEQVRFGDYSTIDRILEDSVPKVERVRRLTSIASAFLPSGDSARFRAIRDRAYALLDEIPLEDGREGLRERFDGYAAKFDSWAGISANAIQPATEHPLIVDLRSKMKEGDDIAAALRLFAQIDEEGSPETTVHAAALILRPAWGNPGALGVAELGTRSQLEGILARALERAAEIDTSDGRDAAVWEISEALVRFDFDRSLEIVLGTEMSVGRDRALATHLTRLVGVNPDSASALLAELHNPEGRAYWERSIALQRLISGSIQLSDLPHLVPSATDRSTLVNQYVTYLFAFGMRRDEAVSILSTALTNRRPPRPWTRQPYRDESLNQLLTHGGFDRALVWARSYDDPQERTWALVMLARAVEAVLGYPYRLPAFKLEAPSPRSFTTILDAAAAGSTSNDGTSP